MDEAFSAFHEIPLKRYGLSYKNAWIILYYRCLKKCLL